MNENKFDQPEHQLGEKEERQGASTMHDHIAFWCDCCSCKAEPQWQEAAEQLGIDLSDREEPQVDLPLEGVHASGSYK